MSDFDISEIQQGGLSAGAGENATRAVQEAQNQILVARKFPRDMVEVERKVVEACRRPRLAELAEYEYPRGDEMVRGETIRLVEVIAQAYGNLDYGVREIGREDGSSEIEVYCWDLENNVRNRKVYKVRHWRDTKKGGYALTDQRDVYEQVANYAARRLRAVITSVMPRDLIEIARDQCAKTLKQSASGSLSDRVQNMVEAFKQYEVTVAEIEAFLGHNLDAVTEREVIRLGRVYSALRDGMANVEDYFGTSLDARRPADAGQKGQQGSAQETPQAEQGDRRPSGQGNEGTPQTDAETPEGDPRGVPFTAAELRADAEKAATEQDLAEVEDAARHFSGGEKAGITRAVNKRREELAQGEASGGGDGGQAGFGGLE